MKKRAYVDSSVWVAAHRGPADLRAAALDVITSSDLVIVTSGFVAVEVCPMAEYYRRYEEVGFYRRYLGRAERAKVAPGKAVDHARVVGARDGLAGLDAVHLAVAELSGCDSIVSFDRAFSRSSIVEPVVLRVRARG